MLKVNDHLVETPMGSTIDSLSEGGYLVATATTIAERY